MLSTFSAVVAHFLLGGCSRAGLQTSKAAIVAAVLGLYAGGAAATYLDGNTLLQRLHDPAGSFERAIAIGYIAGIVDNFEYAQRYQGLTSGFCFAVPESVSSLQLADITRLWLERTPQHRHYGAAGLVAAALQEAYPCKK